MPRQAPARLPPAPPAPPNGLPAYSGGNWPKSKNGAFIGLQTVLVKALPTNVLERASRKVPACSGSGEKRESDGNCTRKDKRTSFLFRIRTFSEVRVEQIVY